MIKRLLEISTANVTNSGVEAPESTPRFIRQWHEYNFQNEFGLVATTRTRRQLAMAIASDGRLFVMYANVFVTTVFLIAIACFRYFFQH